MHEYLFLLLFLFELLFLVSLSAKVFFPIFSAFGFSSGHLNDTLECVHSLAHLGVQLLLNGMKMEVHILAESSHKRQWLLDTRLEM